MPNGGMHHCQGCPNHDESRNVCTLRGVPIGDPYYTTCGNRVHSPLRSSWASSDASPTGPIFAMLCHRGAYFELPYLCDERPLCTHLGGIEVWHKGEEMKFDNPEEYLGFWKSVEKDDF